MKKIDLELELEICENYTRGICNKVLCEKYKCHRTTIQRILKRNNVPLRLQEITTRKNDIINFKGSIECSNDAYILGMIYSDGNLTKNNIEITLVNDDVQIIKDISNYVYGYEKISFRSERTFIKNDKSYVSKDQCRFLISSKNIIQLLKQIGLCENKSLTIKYPNIEKKYDPHFIRGIFDGDGCIFISERYNNHRITIVSNPDFCDDLKKIIESHLDIRIRIYKKTESVNVLSITGNKQIKKFMNWIYKDSDLKLFRKYNKYFQKFLTPQSR